MDNLVFSQCQPILGLASVLVCGPQSGHSPIKPERPLLVLSVQTYYPVDTDMIGHNLDMIT